MRERLSDIALRNVRAWAVARRDLSGSQAIVDAVDELLERRAAAKPAAPAGIGGTDCVYGNPDCPSCGPTVAREIERLKGQLDAAEQNVTILREQVASFAPAGEQPPPRPLQLELLTLLARSEELPAGGDWHDLGVLALKSEDGRSTQLAHFRLKPCLPTAAIVRLPCGHLSAAQCDVNCSQRT